MIDLIKNALFFFYPYCFQDQVRSQIEALVAENVVSM